MVFTETPIMGAFLIQLEPLFDERGWFARTFDREEFSSRGLEPAVVQCNTSFNERAGTLRGMHLQSEPHGEPKLVRCTRGAIFDVIVDVRPASPTHRDWHAVELTPDNGRMLYIPVGVAHGFQTLADHSEVGYQMGHSYVADSAVGVRWDDPAFGIKWPDPPGERVISERDASHPDYTGAAG
jgi:dTDP-4-dehydrorhamnose 3,5-epimerase